MSTAAEPTPNVDPIAQLKAMTEALAEQNKTLQALLTKAPAGTPEIIKGAQGENAKGGRWKVADTIASIDPLKGKGLNLARLAIAKARIAKEQPSAEKIAQIERDFGLAEGSCQASGEVRIDERYRIGLNTTNKAMTDGSPTGGGDWAFDEYASEFIEVLRPAIAFMAGGVEVVPMSRMTMTIPRQASALSGGWTAESSALTLTAPTTDVVQLQLHKWGAVVAISNDLLHDAQGVEAMVRTDLVEQGKRAMDLAFIRGAGTASSPMGVRYAAYSSNVFASNAGSSTATLTTFNADLNQMVNKLEQNNVPQSKQFWMAHPRTKNGAAQLRDGVGRPYYEQDLSKGQLLGRPLFLTTQIPINGSGGGSGGSVESELYLIEASAWVIGMGLAPSIEASREATYYDGSANQSAFSRDETVIRLVLRTDLKPRHAEGAAVTYAQTIA